MKRILTLCLAALLLISLMAGCSTETPTTTDTPADTTTTTEPPATDTTTTTEEPTVQEMGADVAIPFAEPKTFTIWRSDLALTTGYTDYNEAPFWQQVEANTNAHIEWTIASMANANEQFSLMLVSENYTDAFVSPMLTGGYDYSIEEEIIIDLSELAPIYAPHFYAVLISDEVSYHNMITDNGNLPGLNNFSVGLAPAFLGPYVRQDWLEQVGYTETIEYYDQWTEVLELFKSQLGKASTLHFDGANAGTGQNPVLMSGFNTSIDFQVDDNGTVYYAPMEQGYHDYLKLIADWYASGYISSDFASQSFFTDSGAFSGEEYGLFFNFSSTAELMHLNSSNDTYSVVPIDYPRLKADDMNRIKSIAFAWDLLGGSKTCISSQCKEPEALLQWFDYFYTEEGAILANYGIEGESYNWENGLIVVTELISNNPDHTSMEMEQLYTASSTMPFNGIDPDLIYEEPSAYVDASEVWGARWNPSLSVSMPSGLSLTVEESEAVSSRLSDIQTLIEEYTGRIIMGEQDLDSTWDQFVADMQQMNIQECIDVYQAAYDRYIAR